MEMPLKTPVNKFNNDAKYILETNWDDGMPHNYQLYKRIGCEFVEVGSFNCFAEANDEAKEIISRSKRFCYLADQNTDTQGSQQ